MALFPSPTPRWGKVRAAMGRKEPWGLNYLALGNEDCLRPWCELPGGLGVGLSLGARRTTTAAGCTALVALYLCPFCRYREHYMRFARRIRATYTHLKVRR